MRYSQVAFDSREKKPGSEESRPQLSILQSQLTVDRLGVADVTHNSADPPDRRSFFVPSLSPEAPRRCKVV